MTKYTVTVPLLHVRKRIPPQMPDQDGIAGTVKQLYTFEGLPVPVDQVAYLNMGKWYQDTNGLFYWGGGVTETGADTSTPAATPADITNYGALLGLPGKIADTLGHGTVVAILDSGCAVHRALKDKVVAAYDATTGTAALTVNDESTLGHGTFVAGLIAAGATSGEQMRGVAPGVKLIIVKVINDAESMETANVVSALKWLRDECPVKPHIINMSFNCLPDGYEQDMDSLISGFVQSGTILIAAGQDNAAAFDDAQIFYPARHDSVLGIGCISATEIPHKALSTKIKYLSSNVIFSSTGLFDDYVAGPDYRGSSFSAALITGLFALVLSYLRNAGDIASPVDLVNQTLQNFDPAHFSDTLNLYKNEIPV